MTEVQTQPKRTKRLMAEYFAALRRGRPPLDDMRGSSVAWINLASGWRRLACNGSVRRDGNVSDALLCLMTARYRRMEFTDKGHIKPLP